MEDDFGADPACKLIVHDEDINDCASPGKAQLAEA